MSAAASFLSIEGLYSYYGNIAALRGVDLTVERGEVVTLIGANGAGKSTLLMTIFGKPRAARGRIVFDGADITRARTSELAHRGLAQSPEGRRIFPRMSVLENLQMGAIPAPRARFAEDLDRVYGMFPILADRHKQRAGTLSGGEQQMLAIGRALMSRPRLLLLDEPSLGLAPLIVKRIFEVLRELNERDGMTIFLVEQNAYHALALAHRGYVMVNGEIVLRGTGEELLGMPEVRAAYLEGHARPIAAARETAEQAAEAAQEAAAEVAEAHDGAHDEAGGAADDEAHDEAGGAAASRSSGEAS